MPYSPEHKEKTRAKIVESARILFNRHGFKDVTIDMVMHNAGITRGGFYNHFKNKQALFSAAVSCFLMGRGAQWHRDMGVDPMSPSPDMARQMIESYLSPEHLGDLDGQCPMIALPSDVARANSDVQSSYQDLLQAMVGFFEHSLQETDTAPREKALSLAALCVGGMVLAKSLPDSSLAKDIRDASHKAACDIISG